MRERGGLRFDVRETSDSGGVRQEFGTLRWGQFVNLEAVRMAGTYYCLSPIPLQAKATVRQIAKASRVRIIDMQDAASGVSSVADSSPESYLEGLELEQARLMAELVALNKGAPPITLYDKINMVNEYAKSSGGMAPLDVALRFNDLVSNPNLTNLGEFVAAAAIVVNPIRSVISFFEDLF